MNDHTLLIVIALVVVLVMVTRRKPPPVTGSILEALNLTSIESLCQNVLLLGGIGSGKTSLMRLMLMELVPDDNIGFLFHTVKASAATEYIAICKWAGRDYKLFEIGTTTFNPLRFVKQSKWGSAYIFARFLDQIDRSQEQGAGGKEESYWRNMRLAAAELVIELTWMAFGEDANLDDLLEILSAVPSTPQAIEHESWATNSLRVALEKAVKNCTELDQLRILKRCHDFLTIQLPAAGEHSIGSTVGHLSALIQHLTRGGLYHTTCSDQPDTITPLDCLSAKIVIFKDAVLEGQSNQLLQKLFAQILCTEALSRQMKPDMPATLIIGDEVHLLTNPLEDERFLSLGREFRIGRISACQGISTFTSAMPESVKAQHQLGSLMTNSCTKVLANSTDSATFTFFERLLGQELRVLTGGNQSMAAQRPHQERFDPFGMNATNMSMSYHRQLMPKILGSALAKLRTGGHPDFIVEAYVHQAGTTFPETGQPYKKIRFRQRFL